MKHLVTGGSGFLGNLIARRLLERGEDVTILDIWRDENPAVDARFIECDIRDEVGVAKAMQGVDVVHHNVALVPLTKSGPEFWSVNVQGSRVAAEQARKAGVRSFVHMSSSALFGIPESCPITSATPRNPAEIYGYAKLGGEIAVQETLDPSDVELVVIRPRTILGEGRLGIFQVLFEWIAEGRSVYTIGKGNGGFQFVHADDLMDFYMLAIDLGRPGVYNVGTDRFGTLREALENLIRHAGTRSRVRAIPEGPSIAALAALDRLNLSPLAPWHYLTYHKPFYFDVAPLHELGWKAKYSNDELLATSYDSFQEGVAFAGNSASAHRRPVAERALGVVKRFS